MLERIASLKADDALQTIRGMPRCRFPFDID